MWTSMRVGPPPCGHPHLSASIKPTAPPALRIRILDPGLAAFRILESIGRGRLPRCLWTPRIVGILRRLGKIVVPGPTDSVADSNRSPRFEGPSEGPADDSPNRPAKHTAPDGANRNCIPTVRVN